MSGVARWPVVVTRDEPTDGPLSSELRELGLSVLSWPVLHVLPPEDPAPLQRTLARANDFEWIIFASQHAVAAVVRRLPAAPPGLRVAAVGSRTAQSLREAGWPVPLVPAEQTAEGLLAALAPQVAAGTRVLFPAGSRALPTLAAGLARLGCEVQQVEAYRTQAASLNVEECRGWVARAAVGAVTFTSPSAVQELDQALGGAAFDRLLETSTAVTLGPTTGRALAARGHVCVLAAPANLSGLARTTYRLIQMRP